MERMDISMSNSGRSAMFNNYEQGYAYVEKYSLPLVQRERQPQSRQNVVSDETKNGSSSSQTRHARLASCGHYHCGRLNDDPSNHISHGGMSWGDVKLGSYCHLSGQKIHDSNGVLRRIAALFGDEDLSDILIFVGSSVYHAHKVILCGASDVLKVMLTSPSWKDSKNDEIHLKEEEQCEHVFSIFLKYIYTGMIHLSHDNVLSVLMLADKYNVCDLRSVCICYMANHLVTIVSQNRAVSWYQYACLCNHRQLAQICLDFIICNFHKVTCTDDFLNMEKNQLLELLSDSSLVVPDEFILYKGVMRWLEDTQIKYDDIICFNRLAMEILSSIRYKQMPVGKLSDLEMDPIITHFQNFYLEKVTNAIKYHACTYEERGCSIAPSSPRNYTNDTWGTSFSIDDYSALPIHGIRPLIFSSPISASNADELKTMEWNVDLYPKGVQFQKCILIGLWRNLEVSGTVYNTVRLTLEAHTTHLRPVNVTILVYGVQDSIEYVRKMIQRKLLFDVSNSIANFDDLVPFDELNQLYSPYLSGPDGNQFKITIIIKPVTDNLPPI